MQMVFEKLRGKGVGLIDVHTHVFFDESKNEALMKSLRKFNVETAFASIYPFDLMNWDNPSHEEVLRGNLKVEEVSARNRSIRGVVYVNLLNREDVDMAEQFLKKGFGGIGEVYRSVRPRPELIEPFVEIAIEYDVPILIHLAHRLYPRRRSREAEIKDLCSIARRWPKAKIVAAHIGGGGDWENTIEILRLCKARNLYIDTGGSVADSLIIERLVRDYYVDNILFGSDNILSTSVARVEGAEIDEELKIKIYRDNPCRVFPCD